MRTLRTADLFSFARVIKASGIREELTGYLQTITKNDDRERVGMNTILMIIEALSEKKAERAIYEALASIFEMEPAEVETMSPSELFSNLKKLGEENDLSNFFDLFFDTLGKN